MPWWGWIVVGAILLIAEASIGTDFWLVFFGAGAFLVGLLRLAGVHLPESGDWLLFAVASIGSLVLFRRRLRARFHHDTGGAGVPRDLIGEAGIARETVPPGARGVAEIRGSVWKIRNTGARDLAPGDRLRIEAIDGLTLDVRRED